MVDEYTDRAWREGAGLETYQMCSVLEDILLDREKRSHGQEYALIDIKIVNYSSLSRYLCPEIS